MSGTVLACLGAAFLLGGVPFSHLIARVRGVDLRRVGSGNVGATNLARSLGYGLGAFGLVLDASKGAAAVFLPRLVLGADSTAAIEALAAGLAVLGHTFSPFLGFRGGKGVATSAGAFAVLSPRATLLALAVFVLALAFTRIVGLGSVLAALSLPAASFFFGAERPTTLAALVVSFLVVVRHRSNLARIWRGGESRLKTGGPA